jgi:hypothetical protein
MPQGKQRLLFLRYHREEKRTTWKKCTPVFHWVFVCWVTVLSHLTQPTFWVRDGECQALFACPFFFIRQIVMTALYKYAELNNKEIGIILGLDYPVNYRKYRG